MSDPIEALILTLSTEPVISPRSCGETGSIVFSVEPSVAALVRFNRQMDELAQTLQSGRRELDKLNLAIERRRQLDKVEQRGD